MMNARISPMPTRQHLLNGKAGGSMKKIKQGVILLIVLSFVSLFNGCSLKDIKPYEDRLAEKKCQEILSAIDNKDADSLKALFSKQSLADATDLDQGVEYIFSIVSGELQSFEIDHIHTSDVLGSQHSKMFDAYFTITTSDNDYRMYFSYWYENSVNPDMIGVYRIKLVTRETIDNTADFKWGEVSSPAGIYNPSWD